MVFIGLFLTFLADNGFHFLFQFSSLDAISFLRSDHYKYNLVRNGTDIPCTLLNRATQKGADMTSLTLLLLNTICPVLANSVDPDQLASEEAN